MSNFQIFVGLVVLMASMCDSDDSTTKIAVIALSSDEFSEKRRDAYISSLEKLFTRFGNKLNLSNAVRNHFINCINQLSQRTYEGISGCGEKTLNAYEQTIKDTLSFETVNNVINYYFGIIDDKKKDLPGLATPLNAPLNRLRNSYGTRNE